MRAVTIVQGAIEIRDHPDPEPGPQEILVRVRAAGVNNADLLQRAGRYPPPPGVPPDLPGLELAGEVVSAGRGAGRFTAGDRVMALVGGAGQAELAVLHERLAMPVPREVAWEAAGGFPEAFTTAHDALFTQAGLAAGERVCISGAAGGVGTAAVQLAAACGAQVVGTVRRPELRRAVAAMAERAGDPGAEVVEPAAARASGPYDVVLELVGGANLPADLDTLAPGGRVVVIGIGAGARAELDLGILMARQARLMGSTLRSRPLEAKAVAARLVERHALRQLALGRISVPVEATFDLDQAAEAYDRFAAGGKLGKIVISFP